MQKIVAGIVIVVVVAAGAWLYFSDSLPEASDPSEVVATVNGEDITRENLEALEAQVALEQGLDLGSLDKASLAEFRNQTLDTLVSSVLVRQVAISSGITADEAEIDAEIEGIKGRFEDESGYGKALTDLGMSEADLRESIASDIAAQKYMEQVISGEPLAVTENEINNLYEQQVAVLEDAPALEEVRDQIESFLLQQKQRQLLAEHIQELRAGADIEILM